jgi:hypothetical protein
MGANGFLRYIFGAAFPIAALPMFQHMGIDWAVSFFAFVSMALLPVPWMFFKFGPRIRARSRYETTKAG